MRQASASGMPYTFSTSVLSLIRCPPPTNPPLQKKMLCGKKGKVQVGGKGVYHWKRPRVPGLVAQVAALRSPVATRARPPGSEVVRTQTRPSVSGAQEASRATGRVEPPSPGSADFAPHNFSLLLSSEFTALVGRMSPTGGRESVV
jgi:hypothetical protein